MPRASFSRTSNLKLLIDCLSSLGIDANINDRHDVVLNGKKISGSAYKIERDRAYHHGTMLISSDLDSLKSGLVGESDIIGFGVHSVKSPVTRLIDYNKSVTHDSFCNSLICEFRKEYEIYGIPGQSLFYVINDDQINLKQNDHRKYLY